MTSGSNRYSLANKSSQLGVAMPNQLFSTGANADHAAYYRLLATEMCANKKSTRSHAHKRRDLITHPISIDLPRAGRNRNRDVAFHEDRLKRHMAAVRVSRATVSRVIFIRNSLHLATV
eukprot:scaffold108829_cov34-Prasinocladus_malaysianus.AAC.2